MRLIDRIEHCVWCFWVFDRPKLFRCIFWAIVALSALYLVYCFSE